MTKRCFMWLSYAWAWVNGKRMLYNEISFYMLFLNIVCNEALWLSGHPSFDHSSTPADQKVTFTLGINPSTDWGAFIHTRYKPGHPYSTVHYNHISSVCADVFLYFYPCEDWSRVPLPYSLLTAYSIDCISVLLCSFTSYSVRDNEQWTSRCEISPAPASLWRVYFTTMTCLLNIIQFITRLFT